MKKLSKIITYFKLLTGAILITIGIYSEISLLKELSDKGIGFTSGEGVYWKGDNDISLMRGTRISYPINQNYHFLIGFGILAGAILLTGTKLSGDNN